MIEIVAVRSRKIGNNVAAFDIDWRVDGSIVATPHLNESLNPTVSPHGVFNEQDVHNSQTMLKNTLKLVGDAQLESLSKTLGHPRDEIRDVIWDWDATIEFDYNS
ncbi:hypothetical protein JHL21_11420 [Devosia sp. WQ 349]|uniref:hypothetical protein n=1 Tax=Devosia sp. WQ 349K1 TaxID=2800329 RepID=UPI001904B099|nr:hypothetical protein [Devosia sp. WQ 349K1]MBK1795108.1 hypothetical protein [Devosia sp. WQ 349K1]